MFWAVVVAVSTVTGAAGVEPGSGSGTAPARAPRVIAPNSYAQERCVFSEAPTVAWSSRVRFGKTTGAVINALAAASIPGVPVAITRLERKSMDESTLVTLRRMVGDELWSAGWKESKSTLFLPKVRCPDGVVRQSRITAFGWLDPGRALSTEYARIIIDQAEQVDREHFDIAQTRLNFSDPWTESEFIRLGLVARQLVVIFNPDDPEHWANLEFEFEEKGMRVERDADGNATVEVLLSHEDDNAENLQADYRRRMKTFEGTIVHDRLVAGHWTRATGLVYGKAFEARKHVIDPAGPESRELGLGPEVLAKWNGYPPPDWPRLRGFDFGVNHPFTVAWYAEHDGVLHVYREGYHTGRSGSEWARWILEREAEELRALRFGIDDEDEARAYGPLVNGELRVEESWSDHDLEWRKELDAGGVWTQPAIKDIDAGIMRMIATLRERRIVYWRNMLVEEDPYLAREKLPTSVLREYGRYKYPKRKSGVSEVSDHRTNLPVDKDNHGLDRDRYVVASHWGRVEVGVWGVAS